MGRKGRGGDEGGASAILFSEGTPEARLPPPQPPFLPALDSPPPLPPPALTCLGVPRC